MASRTSTRKQSQPATASGLRITRISAIDYRRKRDKPISNGLHTYTHIDIAFVKIETDGGITGWGVGTSRDGEAAFRELFAEKLIGRDPLMTEAIWSDLWSPKLYGRRGLETRALSSLDLALWDIKAKAANMPLYKMLGGFRQRIPTYVAGGYYVAGKTTKDLQAEMASYVKRGARAVKMKVGAVPLHEDAARVKAVRQAIGPGIKLLLDANCAYRYYDAIQFAKLIENENVFWFEEPVQPDDYEGFRKIAAATSIPLATGENEYTKHGFRDLIATQAIAILQPDARYMGGVTEFMKVAALAQAHGLDICPHGDQQAHLHLLAAIPNARMLEFYPREVTDYADVYIHGPDLNDDGTVTVPEVPGLGCDPDEKVLAKYRVS